MEKSSFLVYLALFVVCIVWGTTYLGMRIGVETFPPFLFSGIRHSVAGGIILIILLATGRLTLATWRNQLLPGMLMIAIGNGVVGWSERFIPSGLAALIVSVTPIFIVLINLIAGSSERPNRWIWIGMGLGTVGVALIFRDNLADLGNPAYFNGMMFAFFACLAWALGNVSVKRNAAKGDPFSNAAVQLLSGGLVLLVGSLVFDDWNELQTVETESLWALAYLILVGSIFAYSCFVYALAHLPVGLVSVYAYVNPVVALILGAFALGEAVTGTAVSALLAILAGTYFIVRGYSTNKKS